MQESTTRQFYSFELNSRYEQVARGSVEENNIQCLNQNLWNFMKKTDLEILEFAHENGNYFFLTDKKIGTSLTN